MKPSLDTLIQGTGLTLAGVAAILRDAGYTVTRHQALCDAEIRILTRARDLIKRSRGYDHGDGLRLQEAEALITLLLTGPPTEANP